MDVGDDDPISSHIGMAQIIMAAEPMAKTSLRPTRSDSHPNAGTSGTITTQEIRIQVRTVDRATSR